MVKAMENQGTMRWGLQEASKGVFHRWWASIEINRIQNLCGCGIDTLKVLHTLLGL
jgi:hypothetical protein